MNFNYKNYELIRFKKQTTNSAVTLTGYKVGEWLVVAFADDRHDCYRIYRLRDGLPTLKTTFIGAEDAIKCAEWLDGHYEPFFFIWTEYPHINLWRLTHLTIENGEKYMNILEAMDKQRKVKWDDVCQFLN
jgi:hypothetical protein